MNNTGTSKGKETINGVIPAKSNCYTIAKVNGAARIVKSSEMRRYERNFVKQCTRYKEIGILKSIGLKEKHIFSILNIEVFMLWGIIF